MKKQNKYFKNIMCFILATVFVFSVVYLPAKAIPANAADSGVSDGANFIKMKKFMDDNTPINANATAENDKWVNYLNQNWKDLVKNFKWAQTGIDSAWKYDGKWASESTGTLDTNPYFKPSAVNGVWEVYSPQQFRSAILNVAEGQTIKIMRNLDFNGNERAWTESKDLTKITLDGNNNTIFNIGCSDNSFLGTLKDCIVQNLKFDSAMIVANNRYNTGIFSKVTATTGVGKTLAKLFSLEVTNSVIFNSYESTGMGDQHYISPFGHTEHFMAKDCYTSNNTLYGGKGMHVGGAFARANDAVISSSYSVDSTIVATGDHSGGFISCSDIAVGPYSGGDVQDGRQYSLEVKQCFTNNTVYGNKETGVFIGAIIGDDAALFEDCYASGTVEGTDMLGGFVSMVTTQWDPYYKSGITFRDCYSTSVVGIRNGGKNLGGFIGKRESDRSVVTFTNCFAAGEVGSVDTYVANDRLDKQKDTTVGGFIGSFDNKADPNLPNPKTIFQNCYYDKQTTAMREWESGTTRDVAVNQGTGNIDQAGIKDIQGIRGILTSDSEKAGSGIASKPSKYGVSDAGFTGMGDDKIEIDGVLKEQWIYDGNSTGGYHNCQYPQLRIFADANATNWQDKQDLVKAYSYASVSTVHQQVWEKCSNPQTPENPTGHLSMPSTTYDTVCDLTQRFTMTSYIDTTGNRDIGIKWERDNAKSYAYDGNTPVIGYMGQTMSTAYPGHNRNYWTCDQFSPGITWLTVKITVGNFTGSRRLRVIPTNSLEAGADQTNLWQGGTYDHADDVKMAISDGPRMSTETPSITEGVYPDVPLASTQKLKNLMEKQADGSYTPTGSNPPASFATDDDKFNVNMDFMVAPVSGAHSEHSFVTAKLYKIEDIVKDPVTGKYLVQYDKDKNIDTATGGWGDKINGKAEFGASDTGRYIMEYFWVIPDGRYIRDSKMLVINTHPRTLSLKVVDKNSNPIDSVLELFATGYEEGNPTPAPTFSGVTESEKIVNNIDSGSPGFCAAKKQHPDDNYIITKVQFDVLTPDGVQTCYIENPQVGELVSLPITYYYSVMDEGGNYYLLAKTVEKKYSFGYNAVEGYYYVDLNNKYEDSEFTTRDLDYDVNITLTVEKTSTTGTLIVSKNVLVDNVPSKTGDNFLFQIKGENGFFTEVKLSASDGFESRSLSLPAGKYTVTEIVPMNYQFKHYQLGGISGTPVSQNSAEIELVSSGNTIVLFTNEKTSFIGGQGNVVNKIKT